MPTYSKMPSSSIATDWTRKISIAKMLPSTWALLLILSASLVHCRKFNEPSEFLRSFLTRPHLLPSSNTASGPHNRRRPEAVAVDVIVENWSPYALRYTAHSVESGTLEPSFPPRDMPSKERGFALRASGVLGGGGGGDRLTDHVSGLAGWTLTDPESGMEVSRLAVAWRMRRGAGDGQEFSISLGEFLPDFDDAFQDSISENGELQTRVGREVEGQRVSVADRRTTATARLERVGAAQYRLRVAVVPQNVDIWYWAKYYKDELARKAEERKKASTSTAEKKPLPKKTTKPEPTSSVGGGKRSRLREEEEGGGKPLYYRKDLLKEGPTLVDLHDRGMASLRDALRSKEAKSHAVAVGIQIENWTRFKLGQPRLTVESGRLLRGGRLHPSEVLPGRQDVCAVVNAGQLKGTSGVLRWPVGSDAAQGRVLHVMWSVPYNMQFWSTWASVGLTSAGTPEPTYDEMYKGKDKRRFATAKAGRDFEFSDGALIAMAFMDGGATSKPVLRVRILPRDDLDLAASVRKRLGLPVARRDDVESRSTREDDGSAPQVGRVMDSSASKAGSSATVLLLLSVSWIVAL